MTHVGLEKLGKLSCSISEQVILKDVACFLRVLSGHDE